MSNISSIGGPGVVSQFKGRDARRRDDDDARRLARLARSSVAVGLELPQEMVPGRDGRDGRHGCRGRRGAGLGTGRSTSSSTPR